MPYPWDGQSYELAPVVGQIIQVERHPRADRLWLARVDIGRSSALNVIHGGTRFLNPGDRVAVAISGVTLPSGERIRSRRWRGLRSDGELLSTMELGWTGPGSPDEVAVLPAHECEVGQSLGPRWVQHALAAYFFDPHAPYAHYLMLTGRPLVTAKRRET